VYFGVVPSVFLALILAALLAPLVRALEARGLPPAAATLLVLGAAPTQRGVRPSPAVVGQRPRCQLQPHALQTLTRLATAQSRRNTDPSRRWAA
jgi:hypothetical protein